MKEKLSAGLCDTCKHCNIMYEGNGTDEPLYSMPFCSKLNIEIEIFPDSLDGERLLICSDYKESLTTRCKNPKCNYEVYKPAGVCTKCGTKV